MFQQAKFHKVCVALLLALFTGPSSLAVNHVTIPEPAPSFHKNVQGLSAKSAINSGSGTASFRVQIPFNAAATGALKASSSPFLEGSVDDVIKTAPQQNNQSRVVDPQTFRSWLEQAHPKFALSSSALSPEAVLEVKGMYDNSSKTMRSLGIPFSEIRGSDLDQVALDSVRVMVINCPGRIPREYYQRVRDFVSRGGYLLTTDWSSDNIIQGAFPGYIQWDDHKNDQSIYDAQIVHPDPSLFARTVTNASWKMDIDSHMIRTLRKDVRVLAKSAQLAAEDPSGQGVLAVVFPFGHGYVLHMVGHFDNNTILAFRNMLADPAPVIGISLRQAIAANFVVAGLSGTKIAPN